MIVVGFGLLIKGADLVVEGASDVARRFTVYDMVIGLTVVAFGTSAPELAVNLLAAVQKTTDIAIGNVVGSNIANIFTIHRITSQLEPQFLATVPMHLSKKSRERIRAHISGNAEGEIRDLLEYPQSSVGRIMASDFLSFV